MTRQILRSTTLACVGAALLTACNTAPDDPDAVVNRVAGDPGNVAAVDPVAPSRATAEPIAIKEESDALTFEYVIPAAAAAIPDLRALLVSRADRTKAEALADQAQYAKDLPPDAPVHAYENTTRWSVAADTAQLLVLTATGYDYRGGAHGMPVHKVLYWDKAAAREIPFDALFTDRAAALATVRDDFCARLDTARAKRRGISVAELKAGNGDTVNSFTACPAFDSAIAIAFTHLVGGKFGRITFIVPPYVAGPYAEGDYTLDLTIPKAMIPFVAAKYRPSFPGTGN